MRCEDCSMCRKGAACNGHCHDRDFSKEPINLCSYNINPALDTVCARTAFFIVRYVKYTVHYKLFRCKDHAISTITTLDGFTFEGAEKLPLNDEWA